MLSDKMELATACGFVPTGNKNRYGMGGEAQEEDNKNKVQNGKKKKGAGMYIARQ